jgi:hypothetical protein
MPSLPSPAIDTLACAEQRAFALAYRRQLPLTVGVAVWLCVVCFSVLGRWPGSLQGMLLVVLCAVAPAWLARGPARLEAQLSTSRRLRKDEPR